MSAFTGFGYDWQIGYLHEDLYTHIYIYPWLVFICETDFVLFEEIAEAEEKISDLNITYKWKKIKSNQIYYSSFLYLCGCIW
jgi:hypothetical protein